MLNSDLSHNCLTPEQFEIFCNEYSEEDEVSCDCNECGSYTIGEHRCHCGNRRIAVYVETYQGSSYFVFEAY